VATRPAVSVRAVTPESVGSAEGLHAALDVVAVEGWGGPAGTAVLDYARQRVVRRLVSLRGFTGHAIDEAVTTGLSVAWEVLAAPAVRQAPRPWGVVWRAVDRALSAELLAARHQCSSARAWRVAAAAEGAEGVLFVEDTPRLEHVLGQPSTVGHEQGLGRRLDAVSEAMVNVGWCRWDAEAVVGAAVALAGGPPSDGRTVSGWRPLANRYGIAPWRVRRALLALLGTESAPGILREVMELGPGVLTEPATVDALRGTVVRWGTTRAAPSVGDAPPDPGLERPSIAC
jgi:hypothetical protein